MLVLLAAVGLAVLAFFATRSGDSSLHAPAPGAGEEFVAERSPAPTLAEGERDDSVVRIEVEAFEENEVPPATVAETWRVRVVDGGGETPVIGAAVSVVDLASLRRELALRGAGFDSIEGLRLRELLALRETTGADGCAGFSLPPQGLMVEARSGALWAFGVVNEMPRNSCVTLRLGPDRSLSVKVVDDAGKPVGGVPVVLRGHDPLRDRSTWKWTDTAASTGIATFLHFQRRLEQGSGWHVTFAFPVRGEPSVPVDVDTPAEPPVVLRLPETGSLRIVTRAPDGEPVRLSDTRLRVDALEGEPGGERLWPDGPWSWPEFDGYGEALVPWIGLGLHVKVSLTRGDVELAQCSRAGPSRAGEEVLCELEWRGRWVAGRFVLQDGQAWPAGKVQSYLSISPSPDRYLPSHDLPIDDDGRFRLLVELACPSNGTRTLQFSGPHPGGLGDVLALVPLQQEIPAEGSDLGDVLLDHGERIVSGRVVDLAGHPVAGATFSLRSRARVRDGEMWPTVRMSGTQRTAADGEFTLYLPLGETLPSYDLRLTTRAERFVDDADRELRRGERGVEVVLSTAGALAGSLVFDEGLGPDDVRVWIRDPARRFVPLRTGASFEVQALAPDTYTLEVVRRETRWRSESRPAARVEGLVVRAGETCRDPRIQGLFVDNPFQTLRIRVVDRSSTPLKGAVAGVQDGDTYRQAISGADGICHVRVEQLPVDLRLAVFGYRTQKLLGVDSDREVVLESGLPIRLRVQIVPSREDLNFSLWARLKVVDDAGAVLGYAWGTEGVDADMDLDEQGELAVRVPYAGTYQCEFYLSLVHEHIGRGAQLEFADPLRISVLEHPEEQEFELSIPLAVVEEAVRRAVE